MSDVRLALGVEYDGSAFCGWQTQPSRCGVQDHLEAALEHIAGEPVESVCAGRTDAGVHALGQVASFSLERTIEPLTVLRSLNAKLPADIRVRTAEAAPPDFHARFDARAKTYRYRIWNGEVVNPFERRYVWHMVSPLDVEAMASAARILEGTHDFAAFQGAGSDASTTVRTITQSTIQSTQPAIQSAVRDPQSALIEFMIAGDGFLRHMVRAIVGSLVEIGRGRQPASWLGEVLASRRRERAGQTAPPHGLALVAVDYGARLAAEP
jgi:tRNA pseudouridine38-40 synthase